MLSSSPHIYASRVLYVLYVRTGVYRRDAIQGRHDDIKLARRDNHAFPPPATAMPQGDHDHPIR